MKAGRLNVVLKPVIEPELVMAGRFVALVGHDLADLVMEARQGGQGLQNFLVQGQGLGVTPLLFQGFGKIKGGIGAVRPQVTGLPEEGQGLFVLTGLEKDSPQVGAQDGAVRHDLHHFS